MSEHRRTLNPAEAFPVLRDAEGKRLKVCRYCKGPTPNRRCSWCSQECNDLALIECGHQGHARAWLKRRERGVCQRCGLDTEALRRAIDWRNWNLPMTDTGRAFFRRAGKALLEQAASAGFNIGMGSYGVVQSLWEADHIVPLIEGGSRGAENLQTLCVPCHKRDTADLARRRAEARSPQRRLALHA